MPSHAATFAVAVLMTIAPLVWAAKDRPLPSAPGAAIKFQLEQDHLIIVPVTVNGHGPYKFIIDTGSDVTVVDRQVAADAGLSAETNETVRTLAGVARVFGCSAPVEIARRKFDGTEMLIQDLSNVSRKARGVLGWNVLSRFNFVIDYAHQQLIIAEGDSALEGDQISYRDENGVPVIVNRIPALSQRPLRMTADSGSVELLLFSLPPPPEAHRGSCHALRTAIGNAEVCTLQLPTLQVGSVTVGEVAVGFTHLGYRSSSSVDGLLPLRLFQSVYFDNSRRTLIVNPRSIRK